MKNSEILTAAAALITEGTWCRGYFAFDMDGEAANANDPKAVKWCLLGACCKIAGIERAYKFSSDLFGYIRDGIHAVDEECGDLLNQISTWNDEQVSFKPVRDALLAAVEYAKQDEGHG